MPDFNLRSDSVNVEQIMDQIRARIREKRGADYTEEDIRQLATVKLEKFLDPRGVRSDLLDRFRVAQPAYQPPELPNYAFEEDTLFASTRAPLRWIRKLLLPILKLFFNPNPLIQALNIQSRLNTIHAESEARREAAGRSVGQLQYEVLHNLVVELTRTGIEVKNLRMQVESLASRLEFNERRARSLESVVAYKPSAAERVEPPPARREPREFREAREPREPREPKEPRQVDGSAGREASTPGEPVAPPLAVTPSEAIEGPGQRSRRRRRRRGRRSGAPAASVMGSVGSGDANVDPGGGADAGGDTAADDGGNDINDPAPTVEFDHRLTRPEPFEQTFGAQAHPAEPAVADPTERPAPSPVPGGGGTEEPQ